MVWKKYTTQLTKNHSNYVTVDDDTPRNERRYRIKKKTENNEEKVEKLILHTPIDTHIHTRIHGKLFNRAMMVLKLISTFRYVRKK